MSKTTIVILIFSLFSISTANIEIAPQIVGGRNATLGQFPFVASYQHKERRGRYFGYFFNLQGGLGFLISI